jgi:hypothetical protein
MRRFPPEKRTDKAEVAPTTERHSQLWWRLTIVVVLLGMVLAMLTENGHGSQPSRPHATLTAARAASAVKPKPAGELDCNGYSPIQHPVKPVGTLCAEVHSAGGQLYDNGYYIGHDEPTIEFYSTRPGSSTDVTWQQTLPQDPPSLPTVKAPLTDTTHFFELMPELWYSMALCDQRSYPLLPCKPDSDTNTPHGSYPGGGAAFLELQFYPPGFPPFADALSCDGVHWCAALTIDSLECTAGFTVCNNNCVEPINFAFIARNGVPAGPPSPQLSDLRSFTPDRDTLLMNPGDRLKIRIFDDRNAGALETRITDLTTGKSGYMIASAKNGFMDTSIADCSGSPWNFRPLYSTAKPANLGGWAAANINVAYEVGHFTPCTRVKGSSSVSLGSFSDRAWRTCKGPYERTTSKDSSNPETTDFPCFRAGDTHGPLHTAPDLATGCLSADLDYDGTSYFADWPNSLKPGMFPSAMTISQPTTINGAHYPSIQFLTDNPASDSRCSPSHMTGCVVPPRQAPGHFYPYWTEAMVRKSCVWEFGRMSNGDNFGRDKQYGNFTVATGLAEDASAIIRNPNC